VIKVEEIKEHDKEGEKEVILLGKSLVVW